MTILPLTYLGNIEYFTRLLGGDGVIDLFEHYIKQTYRNRCEIMTAGGVCPLTVNVVKGGSMVKRAVRDMRIDYSKQWQHQHRMAILSAYKSSPFFDHYWGRFETVLNRDFTFLADLNVCLLETVMKSLGDPVSLKFSSSYINASHEDTDLRGTFKPNPVHISVHPATQDTGIITEQHSLTDTRTAAQGKISSAVYEQVFADRFPFRPNLSVIDLIFCAGPEAGSILKKAAAF